MFLNLYFSPVYNIVLFILELHSTLLSYSWLCNYIFIPIIRNIFIPYNQGIETVSSVPCCPCARHPPCPLFYLSDLQYAIIYDKPYLLYALGIYLNNSIFTLKMFLLLSTFVVFLFIYVKFSI